MSRPLVYPHCLQWPHCNRTYPAPSSSKGTLRHHHRHNSNNNNSSRWQRLRSLRAPLRKRSLRRWSARLQQWRRQRNGASHCHRNRNSSSVCRCHLNLSQSSKWEASRVRRCHMKRC